MEETEDEEEEIKGDEHNVETERRKDQGEETGDGSGVLNVRPVASAQQHPQPAPPTGSNSPSGTLETTLQATQTGLQQSADTPNNLPTENNTINKETGRETASDKIVEETSPSSLREGAVDIQKDAEGNNEKSQNNPHVPGAAATVQVHQQDGEMDTINEAILGGETNNKENIQQNDSSSTAVRAVQSDAGTEGNPTANELSRPSIEDATPISKTHDFNKKSDSTENAAPQSAGSVTAPNTDAKPGGTAMPGDSESSPTAPSAGESDAATTTTPNNHDARSLNNNGNNTSTEEVDQKEAAIKPKSAADSTDTAAANSEATTTAITISTNTTNKTTTGDSDSSTAVSHTTSPLLLLVVLCAAAAAVVAA
ncbi:mucin-associated surface protein (MASP) [Trypanosoma cruzi]|nr:mucin-associated surface protein (MASP) [Trypanosoma cruzi]